MAILRRYRSLPVEPPLSMFRDGDREWFPVVQVRLWRKHAKLSPRILAIADTGSPFCLFDARFGRSLGISLEEGHRFSIAGVVHGPSQDAFFHAVSLSIEDTWTVEVVAGFLEDFPVGALLGRRGFFDNFWVRFDHGMDPPSLELDRIVRPS